MERTNPERSGGPDGGASPFGSFWGDCQKEPAQQGGTESIKQHNKQQRHESAQEQKRPLPTPLP